MTYTAREITENDLELIMGWRMDPDVTRWMNTDPVLTLEGQRKWFDRIRTDQAVKYWLLEVDGKPAGVLNLADIDMVKRSAEWGYYVGDKASRSMQLAVSIELSLYAYCFEELGLKVLTNDPLAGNTATVKLHEMCGSRVVEVRKGAVEKNGVLHDQIHMEITASEWESIKGRKFERIAL